MTFDRVVPDEFTITDEDDVPNILETSYEHQLDIKNKVSKIDGHQYDEEYFLLRV